MKKVTTLFIIVCLVLAQTAFAVEQPGALAGPTTMDDRMQQIITVEYKDADLVSVLRSLALTYRLNLLTGPDIKGKVTINLQEITVEKALGAILKANGLLYSLREGVIYVTSGDPSLVDTKTEVVKLKYLTATQAQNMTRKMLSPKGDMKINETANNIIVTDYEDNIAKIRALIDELDTAPKQVLIEAKILDISSSDLKSLGVTFNGDYNPGSGLFGRDSLVAERLQGGMAVPTTSTLSQLPAGQLFLTALAVKGLTVSTKIDALVRDGKANLLASPSIAVINGQEARIVIGKRFPYKERTQTTSGTTETTKFVDIGTSLKVTPQINDDGYITMSLHPEVSSLANALDAGPEIDTREADTTVRIREGETLVIGGLIRQTDSRTEDKIPILGDIPVFGRLFRRTDHDTRQTELAVFITPRILYSHEERQKLGRKDELDKSYTMIDKTADLSMVNKIFENASDLETDNGLMAVRKDTVTRMAYAISQYELIYRQFPDSERAPESKYRIGMIQWQHEKEYKKAKNTFSTLMSDYPKSQWAEQARLAYEQMDREMVEARDQADRAMQALEDTQKRKR